MLAISKSRKAKKDIAQRQHLMERSYARSKRYGFKRARWRRLWRVQIQEYLTAAIQNMMVLVKKSKEHDRAAVEVLQPRPQRPFFRNLYLDILLLLRKQRLILSVMNYF